MSWPKTPSYFIEDFEAAQRLADRFRAQSLYRRLKPVREARAPLPGTVFFRLSLVLPAGQVRHRRRISSSGGPSSPVPTPSSGPPCTACKRTNQMGPTAIKLHDKLGLESRVEYTTNDVSFFKAHRTVQQPDGNRVRKLAPLHKSIYSLHALRQLMHAATARYWETPGP